MAIDTNRLAVVGDLAETFHGLCSAFGLDGEDALGANQHMINIEFLSAGLNGDIVENGVAFCAELLEELAHGLFGFDAAVDQPDLIPGLVEISDADDDHADGNNGWANRVQGHKTELNQPKVAAEDYHEQRGEKDWNELIVKGVIALLDK